MDIPLQKRQPVTQLRNYPRFLVHNRDQHLGDPFGRKEFAEDGALVHAASLFSRRA